MRKTILSFILFFNFLAFIQIKATDILQPTNANNITVNVKNGDKFYDSGGPNANYIDCNVPSGQDNTQNCTSTINICGQGAVNIKFKTFELFPSSGGGDNLKIYSGIKELYNSLKDISPVGKIYTSTAANGCLIVKFVATSVHGSFGWEADLTLTPNTGGTEGPPAGAPGPGCNLSCINSVNVSMPSSVGCTRTLTPADFLQNPTDACLYSVVLSYPFGTNTPGGGIVDRSHLGYTFIYHVVDDATGNSCWGYVKVEDKAGPDLACGNRRASCARIGELTAALGVVTDNCSGQSAPILKSVQYLIWGDGCTDPRGIGQIYRQIQGFDVWGNTSMCNDTITIIRNALADIVCPNLLSMACKLECGNDIITWNKTISKSVQYVPGNGNQDLYPSPYNLVKVKAEQCAFTNDTVVPQIWDSVFINDDGSLATPPFRELVPFWNAQGSGICKLVVGWTDEVYELCPGTVSSFKIRRQWRITNWCTGQDTLCIQYIKVEDKEKPFVASIDTVSYTVGVHDCNALVTLPAPGVEDCNGYNQTYTIEYTDIDGKLKVVAGKFPNGAAPPNPPYPYLAASVYLPAPPYSNHCYTVVVHTTDYCLNDSATTYVRCVYDDSPPTPVCDDITIVTVDPATCWARIYAKDLDNGSRDNCCNVLHFAIATMAQIDATKKEWTDYWKKYCNADYWKYLDANVTKGKYKGYNGFLEDYLNCFVFNDYIDLTSCGDNLVVLRVYEACGVPRYDPHIFPCSEHDWFTYNSFGMCRAVHNYSFFGGGDKTCDYKIPVGCREDIYKWSVAQHDLLPGWSSYPIPKDFYPAYFGSSQVGELYCGPVRANFTDYFPKPTVQDVADNISYAPGNRCSEKRLYNDCMVKVHVDDKTPPVCEGILDLYYYCDGVYGVNEEGFPTSDAEFANTWCGEYETSTWPDYSCRGDNGSPYWNVESSSENESGTDNIDPAHRYYGYYGCVSAVNGHPIDEHDPTATDCELNEPDGKFGQYTNGWAPIYCHSWLILDKYDHEGKLTTPTFWTPKLLSYGKGEGSVPKKGWEDGEFTIWDNCVIGEPKVTDKHYVDQCGNGWYSRTWEIGDSCTPALISCTQKIYSKHRSDFEVMFPRDTVMVCGTDENLSPDVTGRPMVADDDCELVGVNYSDVRFDIIADGCFKIVRTWTLIDWCKYDPNEHTRYPEVIYDDRVSASADRYCVFTKLKDDGDGYMTYVQIIKVKDTIPPVVTCHNDTLCVTTGYAGQGEEPEIMCSVPTYSQVFSATDNCTEASKIEFHYTITNSDGDFRTSGAKVTGFVALPGDLTDGVNTLTIIASDKCGQEDTTTCTILVKDCKKPTPYCYDGIATVVMPVQKEVTVWASDLNLGSYDNCTRKGDLTFSFDAAGNEPFRKFTCADAKPGQVTIYVWDEAGNSDFCTVSLSIQSNDPNCQPEAGTSGSIAGKVVTEVTEPVENVILEAKGSTFKTDSRGTYSFTGLKVNTDYTITPKRDDDPVNGVSTIDLVLIQKHILGVLPLNSAYKVIAADVDRNNDVSAIDLVELRKLILTVYDKLPNNTSWRFVPKAYNFNNATNPWGFPEKIDITGLTKDELNRDFIGVKVGDVNGTVVPHSLLGSEVRGSGPTLKFHTEDRELKSGEESVVEFTAENFNQIEGYQFSLALNGLELKAVHSGKLKMNESNFGMTKLGKGYVTTSWNDSKGISTLDKEVLFSITVKAIKTTLLSESLAINSRYTRAEAYNNNTGSGILDVALVVGHNTETGYALYQNSPNPFISSTVISYDLPKAVKVTLKITDITGRVVRVYNQDGLKGYNQLKINRKDLSGAGVLYYTIEANNFSATKKMVVME